MTEVGISIWHPDLLADAQALRPQWRQWLMALATSGWLSQVLVLVLALVL